MTPARSLENYSALAEGWYWDWGPMKVQFELIDELPPAELIANVRILPFIGEQAVIIHIDDWGGMWDMPGGTLEPGESYLQAVERELLEEAGAKLINFEPFGVLHCWSDAETPYKPHLPFPEFYQLVGHADVELIKPPENPSDGETISEVVALDLDEACRRLTTRHDGTWEEELYRLAASIRSEESPENRSS